MSDPIHFENLVDNEEWKIPTRDEWKRTSQNIKFFHSRTLKYQTEIDNFGMVLRSKEQQYQQLKSKLIKN